MNENTDLDIEEETFKKILNLKKEIGLEHSDWNSFFNQIIKKLKPDIVYQENYETTVSSILYNNFYDDWVKNFAINLQKVWLESSARELDPTKENEKTKTNSAIVIGRGPSIKKHNHFDLLKKSNYHGTIICCDGALINALQSGITPDRFPNYYVVTIDPHKNIFELYDNPIIDNYGKKIKGIFSTVTKPTTVERARKAGIKIHWLHSLFDYQEGKSSFNKVSGLMVRAKNHVNGLPAIQTGGNVGTASWFIGWKILKCKTIALIGINHGWNEDDPLETITSHGISKNKIHIDRNDPKFQKLYPTVYNPDFKCKCILDPIFQYYSNALKEFIIRSPEWLTTINATEGGSIFGKRINGIKFSTFLEQYQN